MKLRSATLRTFTAVHTWTGLVAGFALFVAFYAGAITVFHHDLPAWQSRAVAEQPVQPLDETQRLLDGVLQRHPEARVHMGMLFPGPESSQSSAYWQDQSGTWLYATIDDLDGRSEEHTSELQSLMRISYAVFCLKKKNNTTNISRKTQQRPNHNKTNI